MKDFIKRLSSRKFLLTVAGCLTLYANQQYTEAAATLIIYVLAEGGKDIAFAYKGVDATVAEINKQKALITGNYVKPDGQVIPDDNADRAITPGY